MGKLRVLLVYANPEAASLCTSVKESCVNSLAEAGHEVKVTDLYASKLYLPLSKQDFVKLSNPAYFKPQDEQKVANKSFHFSAFAPELKAEHEKLSWCNLLIFVFPLYNGFMPGILKNWVDRVFSFGFAYGFFSSLRGRKAMFIYTAEMARAEFAGSEPALFHIINSSTFEFCKMTPLMPIAIYEGGLDKAGKEQCLNSTREAMKGVEKRAEYSSPFAKRSCNIF